MMDGIKSRNHINILKLIKSVLHKLLHFDIRNKLYIILYGHNKLQPFYDRIFIDC